VVVLMLQKICNGNQSQRVRLKINGSAKAVQLTVIALAAPAVSQRYISLGQEVGALLIVRMVGNTMLATINADADKRNNLHQA
jgi:hypothetical protein